MREPTARWGKRVRGAGRDSYRRLRTYLIVASQLRTVANDLLRATGVPRDEARRLVRRAAAGR